MKSEDICKRVLSTVALSSEQVERLTTPGADMPSYTDAEAEFRNDMAVYWSQIFRAAHLLPLGLGPAADAVTASANVLYKHDRDKPHITADAMFLAYNLRQELCGALRAIGVARYLAFVSKPV